MLKKTPIKMSSGKKMTFYVDTETYDIYFNGKKRKQFLNKRTGYLQIYVKQTTVYAARIIAKAFCPIPEGCDYTQMQVDHIDSDKTNNRPENLRWVTRQQNNSTPHARKMKSQHWSTTHHKKSTFTLILGNKTYEFKSLREIARFLGFSYQYIYVVNKKQKGIARCFQIIEHKEEEKNELDSKSQQH